MRLVQFPSVRCGLLRLLKHIESLLERPDQRPSCGRAASNATASGELFKDLVLRSKEQNTIGEFNLNNLIGGPIASDPVKIDHGRARNVLVDHAR